MDQMMAQMQKLGAEVEAGRNTIATVQQERQQEKAEFDRQITELQTKLAASQSSSQGMADAQRLVDTRVIGKPDMFYGEREKTKIS